MRAAKLSKRIEIQKQSSEKDEYGELVPGWIAFKNVWAEVRPVTGKSFFSAQQINSEITHQVIIRYTEGVKPSMRIIYKGREFEILYVMNYNEANEAIQMLCKELIK